MECDHLRRDRHAALRCVRALSLAALLASLIAAPAHAQLPEGRRDDVARGGYPDPSSWWAETGRAGWVPDALQMTAWPWTLGGFVIGALGVEEPWGAPSAQPWPGLPGAAAPLAAWDSIAVQSSAGAWSGFGAPLALLTDRGLPAPRRTRATVSLAGGGSDFDDNSLAIERVDSVTTLGALVASGTRGHAGGMDAAGRHLWAARAAVTRGRHRLEGTFAQRGYAATLVAGENEDARGASGSARWRWRAPGGQLAASWSRGWDQRTSFGDTLFDSRRDAQENVASVEGALGATLSARAVWRRAEVRRALARAFEHRDEAWWGAVRAAHPLGGGVAHVAMGAGHDQATGNVAAPEVGWEGALGRTAVRLDASRLAVPVWSDLAGDQAAFLQDTWAGTVALERHAGTSALALTCTGGRTRARALLVPSPLDEVWLRAGARAEDTPYNFVLSTGHADTRRGPLGGGVEGYVVGDGRTGPGTTPRGGGRAWLEFAGRAFQGDLGVRVRAEAGGVGARTAADGTVLPGYATLAAGLSLTIGDAVFTIRGTNLENRAHPEAWIDRDTLVPALSPRRQMRATLTWRLYN